MSLRSTWAAAFGIAVILLVPTWGLTFPERTETRGELPIDLDGIWMVVNQIVYANPTPTPLPGASPAPSPSPVAAAKERILNAVQLLRIEHTPKAIADKGREEEQKRAAASLEKARAILEKEQKPDAKIIVPVVPTRPDAPPPPSGDEVEIFLLDVGLPKTVEASFQKAQDKAVEWVPTDADLATMKAEWKTLKPTGRDEYSKIEWKVTAAANFDNQLQQDPALADAKFAIISNQEMIPKPTQPKSNILVYGVQEATPRRLAGKHVRAMMASAPFPIPIELKGRHVMYRIDDLPSGSGTPAPKSTPAKQ